MTKIDIISGFLGAGKTTFIKKLLEEAIAGEQVVLIENEFGEIGIDGGFLKDAGIEIREMNSGCICCSLVGDFGASLAEVITKYRPERIIIEPSGVGKLSDVVKAVVDVSADMEVELNSAVTIVDAAKCKMYMKNFGEFFNNQIENAGTIVLSRTDITDAAKVQKDVDMLREKNRDAVIITTPLAELSGAQLLEIIEKHDTMLDDLLAEVRESRHHHDGECHEHHHHEGEEWHHHHDGEECHEHHHDGEECHGHHQQIKGARREQEEKAMSTTMKRKDATGTIMMGNAMSTTMTGKSVTTIITMAGKSVTTIITMAGKSAMSTTMTGRKAMTTTTAMDAAAMTMTTIMQMRYSQAGAWRQSSR